MDQTNERLTPHIEHRTLNNLFNIKGMRVIVPGGYGALGEVISRGFAHYGARVAIAGPSLEKSERLADSICANGGDARGFALDARKVDSIKETVDQAADHFGGLDTLINCVGIQREQRLMEVTEETFDLMYETNLKSAMFLAQAVARHQINAGNGGRQIHLLSVRSLLALRDRGYSAYCSTKGGLVMLVKQHAMEFAPHNITVNGVAPTFIQSDRIRSHLEREGFHKFILDRNPLGRIGEPVEVVGQVIALAAPSGSYTTGQIIYIDGGVTASQ